MKLFVILQQLTLTSMLMPAYNFSVYQNQYEEVYDEISIGCKIYSVISFNDDEYSRFFAKPSF